MIYEWGDFWQIVSNEILALQMKNYEYLKDKKSSKMELEPWFMNEANKIGNKRERTIFEIELNIPVSST